jgi:hypothetical protein
MIDDQVAKHPVEPGYDALLVANLATPLDATNKSGLKYVLCSGARTDSLFNETQKLVSSGKQGFEGLASNSIGLRFRHTFANYHHGSLARKELISFAMAYVGLVV